MILDKEKPLSLIALREIARDYSTLLKSFVTQHPFLHKFLGHGVDHIGLIAQDMDDYQNAEAVLSDFSYMIWRSWTGARRVATAELITAISVAPFGATTMLLVSEPRWYEERVDISRGLSYVVFYNPCLDPLSRSLRRSRHLSYEARGENDLAIVLNEGQQEIRFTSMRQNNLLAQNIQSGRARLVAGYPHARQLEAIEQK